MPPTPEWASGGGNRSGEWHGGLPGALCSLSVSLPRFPPLPPEPDPADPPAE